MLLNPQHIAKKKMEDDKPQFYVCWRQVRLWEAGLDLMILVRISQRLRAISSCNYLSTAAFSRLAAGGMADLRLRGAIFYCWMNEDATRLERSMLVRIRLVCST
jgi:hypothetical protein